MNKNLLTYILKSILFGVIFLFVFNFAGQYFNLHIPVNIWTLLVTSLLRIPGVCLLLIIYTLI